MNTKKAALIVLSITLKIVVISLVAMMLMRLGTAAYYYGHSVFHTGALDPLPGRQAQVVVEEEDSIADVAKTLEQKGLISDWTLFYIQVRLSKYYKTIEPGEYVLTTAMTPKEMMAVLSNEGETDEEESEDEEKDQDQEDD
ncbi:MAG: endolytic transglycosylase MltG [Lachnospiraceae bacterium]|jgi:cell division protein YceG involved in septum cleavage|nr:endolytic transglycosylase MltG [Lachnospiraceae bacterium]MCI8995077.1 endolytic transglycosylase MltG [Lachnospiraceae bacterium]MCI9134667.1 endolytic transglycosylase MltG [Lachnospiraceae bacterium]